MLNSRQRQDLDNSENRYFGEFIKTRLTLAQFLDQDGRELSEILEDAVSDGIVPALCSEGCDVEMDGECPHGNPSILLAVGMV